MPRRGTLPYGDPLRRALATATATAAVTGVLLATGACGSNDAPAGETGSADLTTVTVGVIPIVDVAPIYLGQAKGFFRSRGLEVKMATATGGAAIIPGVANGQFDFGFSNVTSLMIAQTRRLPIQVVASGVASTGESGFDFGAVVVNGNSPIRGPAQLSGQRIAVNTLKNIGDVTVRQSVRRAGGDPDTIEFVEVPFPQMPAALADRKVDAAWVVEPFLSDVKGAGGRAVAWNYVDTAKALTVATYFTSAKTAAQDPALVRRFTEAINESMAFADAHPDQVREILPDYMKLDPLLVAGMTLPKWPKEINRGSLDTLASLSKREGLFGDKEPDLDKLLPSP